jgi:hypothetical protein
MTRSLHRNVKVVRAIDPGSLGATAGGGVTSKVIDRNGFESLEYAIALGGVTATNAIVTAKVLEGDATGALTTAPAANVLGTLTMAGATSARASGVSKLLTKRIGYIGQHRYSALKLIPTVSGAINAAVTAILGDPHYGAVASQ